MSKHELYMKAAIKQALKAYSNKDVPIGCIIVHNDKIIARAYNKRIKDNCTISHAEILCIKKACRKIGDWRLENCTMYITLEPCPMCAGAILQARIPQVVVGSMNPKAGCAGSILNLFDTEGFNHTVECTLIGGQPGIECSMLMKKFFKELRMNKIKTTSDSPANPAQA